MDGLFDESRRRTAPPWMVDQLASVEEAYDSLGHKKVPFGVKEHVPSATANDEDLLDEGDAPAFIQKG